MEGLTDSQNGALRDLCAAATREFLVWSAKHIPASKDSAKGSSAENMNAASLLRRLFERMAHPEPYQRSDRDPCNHVLQYPHLLQAHHHYTDS